MPRATSQFRLCAVNVDFGHGIVTVFVMGTVWSDGKTRVEWRDIFGAAGIKSTTRGVRAIG
jgi:limonene-1,2-epoxide hydrolase